MTAPTFDPEFPLLTRHVEDHKPSGEFEYDEAYWDAMEAGEVFIPEDTEDPAPAGDDNDGESE